MGKNLLVGVGSKARKVKALYVGVSGKARKVKKVYVGVGGKARLVWQSYVAATGVNVQWTVNDASTVTVNCNVVPSNATNPGFSYEFVKTSTSIFYQRCRLTEIKDGNGHLIGVKIATKGENAMVGFSIKFIHPEGGSRTINFWHDKGVWQIK